MAKAGERRALKELLGRGRDSVEVIRKLPAAFTIPLAPL